MYDTQRLLNMLKAVNFGISWSVNRASGPYAVSYLLSPRDDLSKLKKSELSYSEIEELCQAGLASESTYDGFTHVTLTYVGNVKLFELNGFDMAGWRACNKRYLCCDRAIPKHCVCSISIECDQHTYRCYGTHD